MFLVLTVFQMIVIIIVVFMIQLIIRELKKLMIYPLLLGQQEVVHTVLQLVVLNHLQHTYLLQNILVVKCSSMKTVY